MPSPFALVRSKRRRATMPWLCAAFCCCIASAFGTDRASAQSPGQAVVDPFLIPPPAVYAPDAAPAFFVDPYVTSAVVPSAHTAPFANAAPPSCTDEVIRKLESRLANVEGQLKKRDAADLKEAEKKKSAEFPSAKITGFTQLDGVWFNQDPTNIATVGNAQDGVGFRRARFGLVGKVAEFTNYMFEFDFATAGRPSFFDVWVEQGNLPYLGTVRGGQYCQPFSVDALTGFRNLTFLERSLPFLAFVPFRRVGVMAYNQSENQMTQWAYSVFKTGGFNNAPLGDDRFATDLGDKGGYSFSTRATHLLWYDEQAADRYLWHVGGGFNYSRLGANTGTGSATNVPYYQSRSTPEFGPLGTAEVPQTFGQSFSTNPIFVDTGRYAADSFNIYGLETVYQRGALGITSEWMATTVESSRGTVLYNGAYVQAAYRLTGEHRVYDKKTGALGKIFPYSDFFSLTKGQRGIHGSGAWEVACRYSFVDLRNPTKLNGTYLNGTSSVGAGMLQDTTLGLTWFLNAYCKIQFNWIHAMLDNSAKGYSQADLYCTRLQVDF